MLTVALLICAATYDRACLTVRMHRRNVHCNGQTQVRGTPGVRVCAECR